MDTEAVKKVYRRYSPIYNIAFKACFQPGRESVIKIINRELDSGSHILEVGVGTGLSLPMYQNEYKITGIDISAEMLAKARKLVSQKNLSNIVDLLEMDAESLTFPDNYFDSIVAMYVVSVVPNLPRVIDEIIRVCKPGGSILIVNHFASKNKIIRKFEQQLARAPKLVGFKADFPMDAILEHPQLKLIEKTKTNLFGYWTLLHFKKLSTN